MDFYAHCRKRLKIINLLILKDEL